MAFDSSVRTRSIKPDPRENFGRYIEPIPVEKGKKLDDEKKARFLYEVSYSIGKIKQCEYVSALDRKDAILLFHQKFKNEARKASKIEVVYVPKDWGTRLGVVFARIGKDMQQRLEVERKARIEAEAREKRIFDEWSSNFIAAWAEIGAEVEAEYKLHLRLQAALDEEWHRKWIKAWECICAEIEYRDQSNIRFRYLEVD